MPILRSRTLEQHIDLAKDVRQFRDILDSITQKVDKMYPRNTQGVRSVYSMRDKLLKLKDVLDSDFHSIATEEQFRELGNIYYLRD